MKIGITYRNFSALLPWLVLLLYLSPVIFFPEDAKYLIHDNLDSVPHLLKMIANSGALFSSNETLVPGMMNGMPRGFLLTEFNVVLWLYYFFPAPVAYSVNVVLSHVLAFLSMRFFIKNHIPRLNDINLVNGVALAFALVPVHSYFGLIIACQPLLLNSFLNIYHSRSRFSDWLLLCLFPLLPNLFQVSFFFLAAMGVLLLFHLVRYRKVHTRFLLSLLLISAVYVLAEHRLFSMYLDENIVSQREGKAGGAGSLNFYGVAGTSLIHFLSGHYQFYSIHFPVIVVAGIFAVLVAWKKDKASVRQILFLFGIVALLSVLYKVIDWKQMDFLKKNISFLREFQFRWYVLFPLLWYILFAFSLVQFTSKKWLTKIASVLIFLQVVFAFTGTDEAAENSFKRTFISQSSSFASFREYFCEDLFDEVKKKIADHDSVNVLCIGFEPAAAQYNGFKTLDFYYPFYPLSYKKEFRKIIEAELEKNPKNKNYFDGWGNKCYVFLGKKPQDGIINQLNINTAQLAKMNCRYIFSSCLVQNAPELNIELFSEFDGKQASGQLKKLYIYKVLTY